MDSRSPLISGPVLSRRQFGLIMGGGAFLLVAGGTYGAVSRSGPQSATKLDTAFGVLSVTRAGRLARLNAAGPTGVPVTRKRSRPARRSRSPAARRKRRAVTGSFERAANPTNLPATSHDRTTALHRRIPAGRSR